MRISFEKRGTKIAIQASNMNYALMVSSKVEERLVEIERDDYWNDEDEFIAYEKCLKETVEELENRAWAGGDIRMGDYILLGRCSN